MAAPLFTTESGLLYHAGRILVVAVGLPARGKTHISRALERYLRWMGIKTQVFSLGDYRRKTLGGAQDIPPDYFTVDQGPKSEETKKLRRSIRDGCEKMIWEFFNELGGQVAIYDANNGTRSSREELATKFVDKGLHVIFLESVCDNQDIVMSNIRSVKISSPDYKGWQQDKAVEDYMSRIKDHEKNYQPIEEIAYPYIKIINVGEKIIVNSRIVFFLMNIHNKHRTIYFARSGQSLIEHSYKADSDLSPAGWEYAEKLRDFIMERRAKAKEERRKLGANVEDRKLVIWTSARRRAHHTAWPFLTPSPTSSSTSLPKVKIIQKPQMSEINPGVWDSLSPDMIRQLYPGEWERFVKDPYGFRAPRAESYHDLAVRLEPTLIELEREQEDLLIIGHASVIRCLLAYFIGLPANEVPAVEIARGDLVEVVPASYGVHSQQFHFWSGPGRSEEAEDGELEHDLDGKEKNFYENVAESTAGKKPDQVTVSAPPAKEKPDG